MTRIITNVIIFLVGIPYTGAFCAGAGYAKNYGGALMRMRRVFLSLVVCLSFLTWSTAAVHAEDKFFSSGNYDVTWFFAAEASEIYLNGSPASGSIYGEISDELEPYNSPLYQQELTCDEDDPLGIGFDSAQDSFRGLSSSQHDFSTGDWAILVVWRNVGLTTLLRNVVAKRAHTYGVYNPGYELLANRTQFVLYYGGATSGGSLVRTYWDGDNSTWHYTLIYRRGSTMGIKTDYGSKVQTWNPGDLSSSALFKLGWSFYSGIGLTIGPVVIWEEDNASDVIDNIDDFDYWYDY